MAVMKKWSLSCSGGPWEEFEDGTLRNFAKTGLSVRDVAIACSRTLPATKARARKLKVRFHSVSRSHSKAQRARWRK